MPQQANLIALHIKRNSEPSISQITEAGILGKIGLNSAGVGVCLNAIRAKGVDFNRLPAHLALRAALDSHSKAEAVARLEKSGVAAAAHILIADATGGTSMECSFLDVVKMEMRDGRIAHSNHFLVPHAPGVTDPLPLLDSKERMVRATELLALASELEKPLTMQTMERILEDEKGLPGAINRMSSSASPSATLFSIVMELTTKTASVKIGRPTQCQGVVLLKPLEL